MQNIFEVKKIVDIPWVEKYRPKSINEMALPTAKMGKEKVDLADELKSFIKIFFKEIKIINEKNKKIKAYNRTVPDNKRKDEIRISSDKAAVLMEGPPGVGKTSIVYALANDLNLQVIETNASDTRTRESLEKKLKETSKSRDIMDFLKQPRQKLILIDEVDGVYGNRDRGAIPTILVLIENTQFPIIMCANEYKTNLQPLYNRVRKFEVHPLSKEEMLKISKNILKKEKITSINPKDLELIIQKNSGDLRGVINDLQGFCQGGDSCDTELISSLRRDSTEEIFKLIRELFLYVKTLKQARDITDKSDVDYNFLYKWINENLPTFIQNNDDLANAYENLSLADEIFGRIRKNMYWGLLPYFYDLFAGGVVLSRKSGTAPKGFRRVSFPRYATSRSFSASERKIIEKIKHHYNISQDDIVQDLLPFLQNLSSTSRRQLKLISDFFEFNAQEKKLLRK
ncbi:MAG: replication factor C large subunit [Promethearchaeota archaeon]